MDTAKKLKDFPYAGRIVPELDNETIRERVVYSYRLIYRVECNRVTFLAILHGKRLLESLEDRITRS
ncbi:MAG: type II toxin-antitoxin system RelE/ParE family toxin [Pseudomonadota bacterium]